MHRTLLCEFDTADACARAVTALRAQGERLVDVYMPYPAKDVEAALALPRSPLPRYVLAAGIVGAVAAYTVLWWTQAVSYPLNVGGRPTHAVPAFIPITFETTILFAAVTTFFGMLWLCRLPRLWHPLFEVDGFERASVDRFFVLFRSGDGAPDDTTVVERELAAIGALRIVAVDLEGRGP